jgi:hypothetical protein
MIKDFSETLVVACKIWLGKEGINFFRECNKEYETVSPVIVEDLYTDEELKIDPNRKQKKIPYPVHFREGMQVRNWMRSQGETDGWSDHDFDDTWMLLIEKAISD